VLKLRAMPHESALVINRSRLLKSIDLIEKQLSLGEAIKLTELLHILNCICNLHHINIIRKFLVKSKFIV
jgi:hypothetical protein